MQRRELLIGLFGLLLGLGGLWLFLSPRVQEIAPEGSVASANGPVIITFNRPVSAASARQYIDLSPATAGHFESEERRLLFWPDEPLAYGVAYEVRVRAGLRGLNGLPLLQGRRASFQVAAPALLFLQTENELSNVWRWRPGEGRPQPRLAEPMPLVDYTLSPDGRRLLLAVANAAGGSDLMILAEGAESPELLLSCPDTQCRAPQWQPGGNLIAFERHGLGAQSNLVEVWLLDLATDSARPAHPEDLLSDVGVRGRASIHPRWSADGRYLSYYHPDANAVLVLDMEGGEPGLLPATVNDMGDWSPAGYRLAYTELTFAEWLLEDLDEELDEWDDEALEHLEPPLVVHLIISDLATDAAVNLSDELVVHDGRPAWSPDGERLVFSRSATGMSRQLWLATADGRDARPLTTDLFYNHTAPVWSPDGRYLAFARTPIEGIRIEPAIWLYDFAEDSFQELMVGGWAPRWIP